MDLKVLATVFASVFIAELGDKTQLATVLFAANPQTHKLTVFAGAALATGIGVLAGDLVARHVNVVWLRYLAGTGFVLIGLWTLCLPDSRTDGVGWR
jgi:putative Ca2+/H+ antiporter (TMEM165/GDT1 family)